MTNEEMVKILQQLQLNMDMVISELIRLRRTRPAKSIYPQESRETLCEAIWRKVLADYQEHQIPFHAGKISRIFSHRLRRLGCPVDEILRPVVPDILYKFVTDKGASVYLPKTAWDAADQAQRDRWYTMSEKDHYKFKEDHRRMVREFQELEPEIERKRSEYQKKLAQAAQLGAHGLPDSEPAFSDLTDEEPSDK